jgi:hypothetical protein
MQQELIHDPELSGTGSRQPMRSDCQSTGALHRVAKAFHNSPAPSEKLTDSTLPLAWPAPYLDQVTSEEVALARASVAATSESTEIGTLPEDYAQLMRKLQAESIASRGSPQVDRALCAAHYISTMIAALAFVAMMAIIVVTCFPTLLPE